MGPKPARQRLPSSTTSDAPDGIPGPERKRKLSTTPGKSNLTGASPKDIDAIFPNGFDQGTFHNYPEVDKIATNIHADLSISFCNITGANPRGQLRFLEISQNIYRTTPNGVRIKFADGSTQLQFPGRLYSSAICGLSTRQRISPQKCIGYNANKQVTTALFRTPIRYPQDRQFTLDHYHSSPPNKLIHYGRKTLVVQCAATASLGSIYFGPDSQYNKSDIDLTEFEDDTLLCMELEVARHAVRLAREVAVNISQKLNTITFTKIVVMTSSERVVRGMTEFLSHWRKVGWKGLDVLFFPKVEANKRGWEWLDTAIWRALENGLEVDLWLVPEEAVGGAFNLVKKPKVKFLEENVQKPSDMEELGLMEGLEG